MFGISFGSIMCPWFVLFLNMKSNWVYITCYCCSLNESHLVVHYLITHQLKTKAMPLYQLFWAAVGNTVLLFLVRDYECVICSIRRPSIKLGPAVKCTKTLCMLHMQSIVGCYHITLQLLLFVMHNDGITTGCCGKQEKCCCCCIMYVFFLDNSGDSTMSWQMKML